MEIKIFSSSLKRKQLLLFMWFFYCGKMAYTTSKERDQTRSFLSNQQMMWEQGFKSV